MQSRVENWYELDDAVVSTEALLETHEGLLEEQEAGYGAWTEWCALAFFIVWFVVASFAG